MKTQKELKQEYNNKPLTIGEKVDYKTTNKRSGRDEGVVATVNCENKTFTVEDDYYKETISFDKIVKRWADRYLGANPINEKIYQPRSISFSCESIVHALELKLNEKRRDDPYIINGIEVKEVNWNPYVIDKNGEIKYYQRDLVWSLKDKQNLIDSIYNKIECGRVLIRLRSFKEIHSLADKGITELAFKDIVDGKQRMHTLKEFMNNEFPDSNGYYWKHFSEHAQWKFLDHQLFTYSEIPEDSEDSLILDQFLRLNFCGVPQSVEHLEYVRKLNKGM